MKLVFLSFWVGAAAGGIGALTAFLALGVIQYH
jgi:hypothetical protein